MNMNYFKKELSKVSGKSKEIEIIFIDNENDEYGYDFDGPMTQEQIQKMVKLASSYEDFKMRTFN